MQNSARSGKATSGSPVSETLELLDANGELKSDVNLPEEEHLKEVSRNILKYFEEGKREVLVTVLNTLGKELVVDCKEGAEV